MTAAMTQSPKLAQVEVIPLAPVAKPEPKLVEQAPPTQSVVPIGPTVKLSLTKRPGQPWEFVFNDAVGIRHINQLQRALKIGFLRSKRRARLQARTEARKAGESGKVVKNGG